MLLNFPQLNLTFSMFVCPLFSVTLTFIILLSGYFFDTSGTWFLLPKFDIKCWFNLLLDRKENDLWQWSHSLFATSSQTAMFCAVFYVDYPSIGFQRKIYICFWRAKLQSTLWNDKCIGTAKQGLLVLQKSTFYSDFLGTV